MAAQLRPPHLSLLCGQLPRRSLEPGEGGTGPRSLWQRAPRGSISEESQHRNPNQPEGGWGGRCGQAVELREVGRKGRFMTSQVHTCRP